MDIIDRNIKYTYIRKYLFHDSEDIYVITNKSFQLLSTFISRVYINCY